MMIVTKFRRCSARGLLLVLLFGTAACRAEIGDSCSSNVECSPDGDRICDTSQPGGYCTVEGCGPQTCPDDAACIRFFPTAFLSTACDPSTEDAVDPAIEPTNDCTPDEVCLESGHCVLFTLERRFCMKSCGDDSDCRDGYSCRRTGTAGAEAVVDPDDPTRRVARFCAQNP